MTEQQFAEEVREQIRQLLNPDSGPTNHDAISTSSTSSAIAKFIFRSDVFQCDKTCDDDCLWCALKWLRKKIYTNDEIQK